MIGQMPYITRKGPEFSHPVCVHHGRQVVMMTVLVSVFIAVRRHHDHGYSYRVNI